MFDNILFATFIPQILMLVGYLFCLLAPKATTNSTTFSISESSKTISYYSSENQTLNNSTFVVDFHSDVPFYIENNKNLAVPICKCEIRLPITIFFKISEKFSFKLFCRPPPVGGNAKRQQTHAFR